jgi:hypothetical protein
MVILQLVGCSLTFLEDQGSPVSPSPALLVPQHLHDICGISSPSLAPDWYAAAAQHPEAAN